MFIFRQETRTHSILKALLYVAVGVYMIVTKANAMTLIVQIVSACILVSGLLPLLLAGRYPEMAASASGVVYKILLAVILFVLADPIAGIIRYVIGGLLCFFGISTIMSLLGTRGAAGVASFILPCILFLLGVLFFSEELIGKDVMGQIAGAAFVLYGVSKGWSALKRKDNGPSQMYEDDSIDEQ